MNNKTLLITASAGWLVLISFGLVKLYNYEFKAGPSGHVVTHWPSESQIHLDNKPYHLIMVAHPRCPCTRATLSELESIMAQTQGKLSAYILFTKPKQFSQEWVKTDLFKNAQRIPSVYVFVDEDSQQARLFGGVTSGQTFLFDAKGELLFSGGITDSRGHEGDNAGKSAIIDVVQGRGTRLQRSLAFGCLLHDEDSTVNDELRGGHVN